MKTCENPDYRSEYRKHLILRNKRISEEVERLRKNPFRQRMLIYKRVAENYGLTSPTRVYQIWKSYEMEKNC